MKKIIYYNFRILKRRVTTLTFWKVIIFCENYNFRILKRRNVQLWPFKKAKHAHSAESVEKFRSFGLACICNENLTWPTHVQSTNQVSGNKLYFWWRLRMRVKYMVESFHKLVTLNFTRGKIESKTKMELVEFRVNLLT